MKQKVGQVFHVTLQPHLLQCLQQNQLNSQKEVLRQLKASISDLLKQESNYALDSHKNEVIKVDGRFRLKHSMFLATLLNKLQQILGYKISTTKQHEIKKLSQEANSHPVVQLNRRSIFVVEDINECKVAKSLLKIHCSNNVHKFLPFFTFKNLTCLTIEDKYIMKSIEWVTQLDTPNLKNLFINCADSKFSIKPIAKCFPPPTLRVLTIVNLSVPELSQVNRCFSQSNCINKIYFANTKNCKQESYFQENSSLAKSCLPFVQTILASHRQRDMSLGSKNFVTLGDFKIPKQKFPTLKQYQGAYEF